MRRYVRLFVAAGLVLGALLASSRLAPAAEETGQVKARTMGEGPAYETIGKLAVMHAGRIKPFDTVAREEVKHVFGRETIKLLGPANKVVETWGATAAFFDWMVRPEFWDDQPFILVDYLPLRRLVLGEAVRTRLKEIAAKESTAAADRARLEALAGTADVTSEAISAALQGSQLIDEYRKELTGMSALLGEERKWLTPGQLQDARINYQGQPTAFMEWVADLDERKQRFDANPASAERLNETERRAIDVGRRLMAYKAYSGDELRSAGMVRIMPRPASFKALGYITGAIAKAREGKNPRDLAPIEFDSLKALDTYWNDIPRDDRHEPGQNAQFDEKFTAWLRDNSVWMPLKVLLKTSPEELAQAGFPEAEARAFLAAYHELEQAEKRSPGAVEPALAAAMFDQSRKLGEAVNPTKYPSLVAIERETHFNAMNPFWQAPIAYGAALFLLAISLGFVSGRASLAGRLGRAVYGLGLAALVVGIALEIYGFYLRIYISGWAPVTNMYETVIWVALVAAVLALVFELIYRRTFAALAGSAVALLGTITAVNVPLLDPSIKSLQPVLRSNFWLAVHVLTEVSSYAAFGLAWALGLIALGFYLTATYRRSPRFAELALPMIPGLPLLAVGILGALASNGVFGAQWAAGDTLFYAFSVLGGLGGILCLSAVLALAGELANRVIFRETLRAAAEAGMSATRQGGAPAEEAHWEGDGGAGAASSSASASGSFENGGVATIARPTVAAIRASTATAWSKLDARARAMQETAQTIKPLSNFIYRAMQVGVLLIAAGTILGGVWADYSWGRFWGWDPKEVWALITLLVYLVPLHGRFAGWVNTFVLVCASVVCFLSVIMAWYGVNFVLGVGLHSYGFTEGGSQGFMSVILAAMMAIPVAAYWRRRLGYLAESPAQYT